MKKIVQASFLVALITIASITISISNPSGAPDVATGSPADGATCGQSGCHNNTATSKTGIITSDIPSTGYMAGGTYNITVTVTGSGAKGFQVSPQKTDGTLLGTLTPGTGSRYSPTQSYITHSSQKTGASAIWKFTWKAPAKGTGAVDFYGAFAVTRNTTYTEKVTYQESANSSITELSSNINLNVYPNPLQENINVSFDLKENAAVSAQLISMDGKENYSLYNNMLNSGNHQLNLFKPTNLQTGIYFLQLNLNDKQVVKKVFVD